jgi:hypothetical protein
MGTPSATSQFSRLSMEKNADSALVLCSWTRGVLHFSPFDRPLVVMSRIRFAWGWRVVVHAVYGGALKTRRPSVPRPAAQTRCRIENGLPPPARSVHRPIQASSASGGKAARSDHLLRGERAGRAAPRMTRPTRRALMMGQPAHLIRVNRVHRASVNRPRQMFPPPMTDARLHASLGRSLAITSAARPTRFAS